MRAAPAAPAVGASGNTVLFGGSADFSHRRSWLLPLAYFRALGYLIWKTMRAHISFLLLAVALPVMAQETAELPAMPTLVEATAGSDRLSSFEARMASSEESLVRNLEFVNVGPTIMSGRIVDIDANASDPTQMYVAYASGGLWRSSNNGQSFEPLFDHEAAMTIGDIAVDWARGETIWVGTGENNSSRSSYAGTGVYQSKDGGKTWVHKGLEETHRIGRILLHPGDEGTLWVAALGALYSSNENRGVFKSTDGGATWRKTLFVSPDAGAIDLVMDPNDPDVLYAALWHRQRRAWNFVEGGVDSGVYKSTDGGENWIQLSFGTGTGTGRIGLAMYDSQVMYAVLDNQNRRPAEDDKDAPALTREMLRTMTREAFLTTDTTDLAAYLDENGFGSEYSAEVIFAMVRKEEIDPIHLVWYVEDANRELFDTPVVGAEVYRSDDAGATWLKTHDDYLDNVFNSYGYYFGEIRVDPVDQNIIYVLGVPLLRSGDGGATWSAIGGPHVHADHQALWVNPKRSGHLINGNDGGINISYDDGNTFFKANTPSVGQFYAIGVDDADPYHVYGGLQDNGVWGGPHTYQHSYGWYASGTYPYDRYLGGDGMQVEIDTRTNNLVYTGSQFGFYVRIDKATGRRTPIRPGHTLGERPLRFNWQTPIHLSRHNQDVLYYGSNKVHRSFDRGDNWETLSDDLTRGGRKGDVPFGTLTTIDESPLRFGLVYVGSDDGLVHVSKDGGYTWERISDSLPHDLWVSRVEASAHHLGRVYVALNGYRWDHFDAYLYRSDDYGATWTAIAGDLPREPVNVILEDSANENVLYVGTDHGAYVSLDRGTTFMAAGSSLPHAPVHDLKIQARAQHLLVGTHGRSIYRADISHVQALTSERMASPVHVFDVEPVTRSNFWGRQAVVWREPSEPSITLVYWAADSGNVTITVEAESGDAVKVWEDEAEQGLNYVTYDLSADSSHAAEAGWEVADSGAYYLVAGDYTVTVALGSASSATALGITRPR